MRYGSRPAQVIRFTAIVCDLARCCAALVASRVVFTVVAGSDFMTIETVVICACGPDSPRVHYPHHVVVIYVVVNNVNLRYEQLLSACALVRERIDNGEHVVGAVTS